MHFSFAIAVTLSIALSSLAAPLHVEEGLSYRGEDLDVRGPDDWSTIPRNKKFKLTSGLLAPNLQESGTHITYKEAGHNEKPKPLPHVAHYEVWKPNPYKPGHVTSAGRWRGNDGVGKTHGGIPPPVWHPAGGEVKGKKAYPATPSQNPPSYVQQKFSKSIKGKVDKMQQLAAKKPLSSNPNHKGKSMDDLALNKGRKKVGHVVTGGKGSKSI